MELRQDDMVREECSLISFADMGEQAHSVGVNDDIGGGWVKGGWVKNCDDNANQVHCSARVETRHPDREEFSEDSPANIGEQVQLGQIGGWWDQGGQTKNCHNKVDSAHSLAKLKISQGDHALVQEVHSKDDTWDLMEDDLSENKEDDLDNLVEDDRWGIMNVRKTGLARHSPM